MNPILDALYCYRVNSPEHTHTPNYIMIKLSADQQVQLSKAQVQGYLQAHRRSMVSGICNDVYLQIAGVKG